jgi:ribosomal protein S18 acetylase RimI-like enzyme
MNSKPQAVVRLASAGAAEVIAALNEAVQSVHHNALPDEFLPPDPASSEPFFAEQLVRPEVLVWLAELDGNPVGYVLAECITRAANAFTAPLSAMYVHHLAVIGQARRSGVGRRLMQAVEVEARARGMDDIRLDYWSFNERARGFFATLGYEPYNERARLPLGRKR